MKIVLFYLLLFCSCHLFAHEEFEQNDADGIEKNVDFSPDDQANLDDEPNSREILAQDESEEVYDENLVENNVDPVQTAEQNPNEIVHENAEHVIGSDSSEVQTHYESEQHYNEKTVENNPLAFSNTETEQSPSKVVPRYESDNNEQDNEAASAKILVRGRGEVEQDYNTETVENEVVYTPTGNEQNAIEVVPKYQVDNDDHDVGTEPLEILTQGQGEFAQDYNHADPVENDVYTTTENEQSLPETGDVRNDELVIGTDFIEILGLPDTVSTPRLRSTVRYSIAGPRILVIDIFAVGMDQVKSIYHTEWTELLYYADETKAKILRVTLPDSLVYKEDKILHISPDLHSETLLVRACIVDYENPSVLLLYAEHSVKLTPPWSRLAKYRVHACSSWIGMFFKNLSKSKIPKCAKIDDIVELLSFPVPLVADEYGYKKFFTKLREAEELQNRLPQFTIATWLYLTKRCSKDMCPLLYHIKGTAYQTPLIGLLRSGYLHLQFHYEDGSGYAFLLDAQIPVHKWVHITVANKNTVVTVYLRYGRNLQFVKTFEHSDFPAGLYHYNDTDGHWGIGGSPGFISAQGFIGPARIYRRHVLSKEAVGMIFTPASRPNLGIAGHFKSCRKLKSAVNLLWRKERENNRHCPAKDWLKRFPSLDCNVDAQGLAAEIVPTLAEILNLDETISNDQVKEKVYDRAFTLIKAGKNKVKDALLLLSYSSCHGHPQSLYLLSVLYRVGLGVTMDQRVSQRFLLLGALYNHPLSQMSLAYKHYIGVDGLPKDHEVAGTYYRYAAVQSNRLLVEHNEVDTHSEAVRLDKKEDLENYRGPNSNWFSWLKHQAKRGVTDAQSALGEVFYYGSRGFRRNLTKAAEFYEMGANRGDAQMLFNLGVVKLRGQGVSVNAEEARDLLKKSAELGFAPAYNALGYYELNVRQNKSGAVEYFRYAAEHEDRDGLYNLGFALENGLTPGSVGDLQSAMPYYVSAANKGHSGACVVAGDAFSLGQHVERDIKISIIFHKFVADQIPEIGFHLRNGLDGYFEKDWYQSLLYYILAAEAGMEVAQYNVALLCEWDWGRVSRHSQVDCAWRYYNHSAKLEWVPSLIKTGDNHWYGITAEKNITMAAQLYSQAATKEQNPQAIYNLGYLVENNYPLDGLTWTHFHPSGINPGNLTLAAAFYRKCRDSSDEALVPCSLGLVRVAMKMAWQLQLVKNEILFIPLIIFIVGLALLYCIRRLTSDRQMIDLA